jgi:hypothetical protein
VNLDGLLPPAEEESPTPDELVDLGWGYEEEAAPAPETPEPTPLAPADAVPVFRVDLTVEKGAGAGLFEVTDPASGRHFTLYEFELSIARMLDGRRHASDVIENGVRLGIPVDLDGLYKFIRQLWRYGFLAPPGTPSPPDAAREGDRPERERWDEATRSLFQTGLRLVRQGRPQDAASYFHAVLDADPDNAEAAERLAAIERGETVAAIPIGFRPRRGASPAGARGGGKRLAVALSIAGLVAAGAVAVVVVTRRSAPPPAPPRPPPQTAVAIPAVPPPAWRTAAVQQRAHPPLGTLEASAGGSVLWRKPDGSAVEAGERVGVLRVEAAPRGPVSIDPAAAARIKELEALAAQDPVYRDFLEKARRAAQRPRSGRVAKEVPLLAPASGTLALTVESKAAVERGAPLASVVDAATWVIDAFVDGAPPSADAACELRGDAIGERVPCRLGGVRPRDGGSELTLTVSAEAAAWVGGSRSLRVRVAPPGTPTEVPAEAPNQGAP